MSQRRCPQRYVKLVLEFEQKLVGIFFNISYCSQVSAFDLISHEEEVLPEMDIHRVFSTSISYEKYICVFGGFYDAGKVADSCER